MCICGYLCVYYILCVHQAKGVGMHWVAKWYSSAERLSHVGHWACNFTTPELNMSFHARNLVIKTSQNIVHVCMYECMYINERALTAVYHMYGMYIYIHI